MGTVRVALSPVERFQEFLESRGKRITAQKRLLVEHVFRQHAHFEADQLVEELSYGKRASRVSRPTVYRCLSELVEAGLLRAMNLPGRCVYEHDYGYPLHDHLYCVKCHKLIEFQSDELLRVRAAAASQHQFQVTGHRLLVQGVCQECRQARQRVKRPVDLV
ncbi:MAG TPA: Fur family transcriptional regulator [Pirellulaceae bacterium]